MNTTTSLLQTIDRFSALKVAVVGDIVLDHYIWGEVSRISPEAPVVVVNVSKEEYSLGGAANVAKNIASLGARASLTGIIGSDLFGERLRSLLQETGVDADSVVTVDDRSTTVKSRVLARAQQVVRVDRESSEPLAGSAGERIAELLEATISNSDAVIVSDYAKGVLTQRTYAPLASAYQRGAFRLDGKPLVVDPKDANFDLYSGATVVKPNRKEAEAASGIRIRSQADGVLAARKLLERWSADSVLVTLGELGMVAVVRDESIPPVQVPTQAREVYDVSGAGDTVAAVFTLALASGASLAHAAMLSNFAAGVVVAEIGAVAIELDQLRQAVQAHKE